MLNDLNTPVRGRAGDRTGGPLLDRGTSRGGQRQVGATVVLVAVLAAGLTFATWAVPWLLFAYPLPGIASFTAALTSGLSLAVCILFAFRHQRTRRRTDLVIASVFGLVAIVEGVLPVVAQIGPSTVDFAFWTRVMTRTIVALGLCVAAWIPERRTGRSPFGVVIGSLLLTGVVFTTTLAQLSTLPATVEGAAAHGSALIHAPTALAMRLLGAVFLLVASWGFVRRCRGNADGTLGWLACGAVLMATARVHDAIYPSLHNDWVTTGDMLRLTALILIVAGMVHETVDSWGRRALDVRNRERRALAAELHDGLAQELAYLTVQTALAEKTPGDADRLARVRDAAERALSEARAHIDAYRREIDLTGDDHLVSLDGLIRTIAADVRDRYECRIALQLDPVEVRAQVAHELGRVTGEALTNAARHARPSVVHVHLVQHGGTLRLLVEDDGVGLVDTTVPSDRGSYGMTSMQQRAERLGGRCTVSSAPASGTLIAVEVPTR